MNNRKIAADRGLMHALLTVVNLMDEEDTVRNTMLFRASMPSLGSLFRAGEQSLFLDEAVKRALDLVEAE